MKILNRLIDIAGKFNIDNIKVALKIDVILGKSFV